MTHLDTFLRQLFVGLIRTFPQSGTVSNSSADEPHVLGEKQKKKKKTVGWFLFNFLSN